jgi:tetratricopeptide (TPR) repeat protein
MKKPSVTKTSHLLPFDQLSPAQFERLCLWLVEREGYLRPEHLGEAGSEQGRDVVAYRATETGEQLWYFQCKRYQTIGAATLIKEVEKYNKLVIAEKPSKKPFGIVFVTSAALSAKARKEVKQFCGEHGCESEFWARTELDMLVKKYDDIVAEFFSLNAPSVELGTRIEAKGDRSVVIYGDATGTTIITGDGATQGAASKPPPPPAPPRNHISISRLPVTGSDLFGREAELKALDDAWANPDTKIMAFVAWGGVGKTALVNHWLKKRMVAESYRGAERVYGWSFYSQGTSERAASADLFIDQALRSFGDTEPTQGSPWDKGERLAQLIRQTRTLLILDGLEPLQHPPGPQEGRLKDAALAALLVELGAGQPGLCVISTRERVGDLVEFDSTVVQHDLEHLSPQAGARLLRAQGVKGDDDELEQAATEYGGHALALTLLGSYLADVYAGEISRRNEIEDLEKDARHGRHAEHVMRAYEKWLAEGVELAVLRLLGLFDRPADIESIMALRAAPAIPGLTESFQGLKGHEWQQALAKLRRIKLLGAASVNDPNTLDAHPLVREHFRQQLKRERPEAWREANNRLYEHLKRTAKEFPDTVEEMSPLYAAVAHGCEAGRHQEALDEVYWPRILRTRESFNWKKLGAYGADLAAIYGLFEIPWEQPSEGLGARWKPFVLNRAGFDLRALGRLREAAQPMRAGLEARIAMEDWENAAVAAGNLSGLYLTIGELLQALKYAQQSVQLADRSGDQSRRVMQRTALADAFYQAGQIAEAADVFREAEEIQKRDAPEYPVLYSLQGFRYCELLLGQGRVREVKDRAARALEWASLQKFVLDIALDNLSLGCAWMLEAEPEYAPDMTRATEFLRRAVDGLRQAGAIEFIPRGLLARAALHRVKANHTRAERDLAEALRISTRCGMGLHLADCHLESARLQLAQGNRDKAREHWETAKKMIDRMGYHRRDRDVDELAQKLH